MKICAVSDTHAWYTDLKEMPEADVFVHAGDIECYENISQVMHFKKWLDKLPYKRKIVIPGNHDRIVHEAQDLVRSILKDSCDFLINQEVVIDGLKFYGSPYTPTYGYWYFMKQRGDEISREWEKIPHDTDVLITHGPPLGVLDKVMRSKGFGENVGCYDLARFVKQIKPQVHIFGHIHEGYGMMKKDGTRFYNVSIFNERFEFEHRPTLIEI